MRRRSRAREHDTDYGRWRPRSVLGVSDVQRRFTLVRLCVRIPATWRRYQYTRPAGRHGASRQRPLGRGVMASKRHRKTRLFMLVAGVVTTIMALAAPSQAYVTPVNHVVLGSGSDTTFQLMTQMDQLINASPTCELVNP